MAVATTPVNLPSSSPPFTKKFSTSASALQYTGNGGYYNSNVMTLGKRFGRQLRLGNVYHHSATLKLFSIVDNIFQKSI